MYDNDIKGRGGVPLKVPMCIYYHLYKYNDNEGMIHIWYTIVANIIRVILH